jgi:hypothetical protein
MLERSPTAKSLPVLQVGLPIQVFGLDVAGAFEIRARQDDNISRKLVIIIYSHKITDLEVFPRTPMEAYFAWGLNIIVDQVCLDYSYVDLAGLEGKGRGWPLPGVLELRLRLKLVRPRMWRQNWRHLDIFTGRNKRHSLRIRGYNRFRTSPCRLDPRAGTIMPDAGCPLALIFPLPQTLDRMPNDI